MYFLAKASFLLKMWKFNGQWMNANTNIWHGCVLHSNFVMYYSMQVFARALLCTGARVHFDEILYQLQLNRTEIWTFLAYSVCLNVHNKFYTIFSHAFNLKRVCKDLVLEMNRLKFSCLFCLNVKGFNLRMRRYFKICTNTFCTDRIGKWLCGKDEKPILGLFFAFLDLQC